MSCRHVHDFIRGATIALPHAILNQPVEREGWDILHPNQKAVRLILRHVEALDALKIKRKRTVAAH